MKWLRLRPSLQYIIYPGSTQNVDNTWVGYKAKFLENCASMF
ncbi:hypothetical protein [Acinetobacter bereziniae]